MKTTPKGPVRPAKRPAPTSAVRARNSRAAQDFFGGIIQEMRRVTWPTREEWIAATILTVVLVVGVGVFTYLVDIAFGAIFSFLTGGAR
jgi:preprotein translocase subunit SecE